MKLFLWLLVTLVFSGAKAQEGTKVIAGFDPKTDLIADNYEAGPFLIYDCEEGHWTCVGESDYKDCQEKREEDRYLKKIRARCAPLGLFPTKKGCFQRQLFMTSNNHGTRVCVLPDWKEKEILFDFRK